jgi:hypothetical protein
MILKASQDGDGNTNNLISLDPTFFLLQSCIHNWLQKPEISVETLNIQLYRAKHVLLGLFSRHLFIHRYPLTSNFTQYKHNVWVV